jgi:GT2 family glycosyltransferase
MRPGCDSEPQQALTTRSSPNRSAISDEREYARLARLLYRPIVFQEPQRVVHPGSWLEHVPFAFWIVEALRPAVFVELGTQSGNSYASFAQAVQMLRLPTSCYAVDTWRGDSQTGFYDEGVFTEWATYHDRHFSAFSRLIRSTFAEAAVHFADGSIDLLHMDGCHTYEAVAGDFRLWHPKLSRRGVILIHDINVRERDFGAWRLWEELKAQSLSFEFLHGHGLGVLAAGSDLPEPLQWLFSRSSTCQEDVSAVRQFFARVGGVVAARFAAAEIERDSNVVADRARVQISNLEVQLARERQEQDEATRHQWQVAAQLQELIRDEIERRRRTEAERDDQNAALSRLTDEMTRMGSRLATVMADLDARAAQAAEDALLISSLENQLARQQEEHEDALRQNTRLAALQHASRRRSLGTHATLLELQRRLAVTEALLRKGSSLGHGLKKIVDRFRAAGFTQRGLLRHPITSTLIALQGNRTEERLIESSGLFDGSYYVANYPESADSGPPIQHFLRHWAQTLASPHPLFDTSFYLQQRPDLVAASRNPLVHYLGRGSVEGLDPHPLFSTRYYQEQKPSIGFANPLTHFVRSGAAEGRSPHPLFDVAFYNWQRPDIAARGENPLHHYLTRALEEDVDPHPLFDTSHYLSQVPELREAGLNPLLHFLFVGWREGLNPSATFSVEAYLARYPDIAAAGVNPLEHYVRFGKAEGRTAVNDIEDPDDDDSSGVDLFEAVNASDYELERLLAATPLTTEFRFSLLWNTTDRAALDSIRGLQQQSYPNWRLMLTAEPGASLDALPASLLNDPRVRTCSAASTALANHDHSATGDAFVSCLCAGDMLHPHALLLLAHTLQTTPRAELIFTDEEAAGTGVRHPILKPGWDPLLYSAIDYLGPSAFIRADRLNGSDAAQAGLTCLLETIRRSVLHEFERDRAVHLPYPLVKVHPDREYEVRRRNARSWVDGMDAAEAVAAAVYGDARADLPKAPLVSILIATKNQADLLSQCVDSILDLTAYPSFEVLVIDNGSDEPAAQHLLRSLTGRPPCRVICDDGPFNFSRLNNRGAAQARGQILCLLNNDIVVSNPHWLGQMIAFARRPSIGAVGTKLLYPDGRVQHAGVVLGANGLAAHAFAGEGDDGSYMGLTKLPREVSAVTGACLVVAKDRFTEFGGLDARDLPVNFNDIDLCLKLRRAGYTNIVLPLDGITHRESASRAQQTTTATGQMRLAREADVMRQRWGDAVRRDPYYNQNLSLVSPLYRVRRDQVGGPRIRRPRRINVELTSLGRESRLDIYADMSNSARVAEAHGGSVPQRPQSDSPGLSVLVLNKDAPALIRPLVEQLHQQSIAFKAAGLGFEVLIGDTGSTDPSTLSLYSSLPDSTKVVRDLRYNFSRCNNLLETLARFDTVLFLNNDIVFPAASDLLLHAHRQLQESPRLGVLGSVLYYPDGSIQHMGCQLSSAPAVWGLPYHINARTHLAPNAFPRLAYPAAVTGAFLMIARALFRQCGTFDIRYRSECQDVALCLEARRLGYDVGCANLGQVIHIENGTRKKGEESWSDRRRFLRMYGAFIQAAVA